MKAANELAQATHASHMTSLQQDLLSTQGHVSSLQSELGTQQAHVSSLQRELEAERGGRSGEVREVEATYQQEIRRISTEHAQKVLCVYVYVKIFILHMNFAY